MLEEFEEYLKNHNLSANTITSYSFALKQYLKNYNTVTRKNLKQYKLWLIETYKPETVNLRIRAINCYLESINKVNMKIPPVKIQHKNFLENVISEADYIYFKNCLKSDDEMLWYFVIRFLAATGARIRLNTLTSVIWIYIPKGGSCGDYTFLIPCSKRHRSG